MLAIASPVINLMANDITISKEMTPFDIAGIISWCVGFYFEVVADWQVSNFLSKYHFDKLIRWLIGEILIYLAIVFAIKDCGLYLDTQIILVNG